MHSFRPKPRFVMLHNLVPSGSCIHRALIFIPFTFHFLFPRSSWLNQYSTRLDWAESYGAFVLSRFAFSFLFSFFFFFIQPQHLTKSSMNSASVHCSWTHKFHFSVTFSLKMGPTTLFTHLKIILLQYFQFQFSVSTTISSIQTDP